MECKQIKWSQISTDLEGFLGRHMIWYSSESYARRAVEAKCFRILESFPSLSFSFLFSFVRALVALRRVVFIKKNCFGFFKQKQTKKQF